MTQPAVPKASSRSKARWIRIIVLTVLSFILLLMTVLAVLVSSDRGSRWALEQVLKRQHLIEYRYVSGNIKDGLILEDIAVRLKPVHILANRADVSLGWRSLFDRQVHLSRSDFGEIQIVTQNPPSDEPFKFNQIRLPFTLHLDHANAEKLVIQTYSSKVNFYDIYLQNAHWSGTELKFENSAMDMGYLNVKNATGQMAFEGKYPLSAIGDLTLPSLKNININTIKVNAKGSLDRIEAGFATNTPDLLRGWGVIRPVTKGVPMFGEVQLSDYHLPFLTQFDLHAEQGVIGFDGDVKGLNLTLNADLEGKNIPKGLYNGQLFTNFKQLDVHQLTAQIMGGEVDVNGVVSWQDHVNWDVKGRLNRIDAKDPLIPQVVQDFLPAQTDANIASQGHLKQGLNLNALVDFDQAETWRVNMQQKASSTSKTSAPIDMNVAWTGIDRAMPYVGWLKSKQGDVDVVLQTGAQKLRLNTWVEKQKDGFLPTGHYQANIHIAQQNVKISDFILNSPEGRVLANMSIALPHEKRQLSWLADIRAQQFNPQQIVDAAPVSQLTGTLTAAGRAEPQKQLIQLKDMNLIGRLSAQEKQSVQLTGQTAIALLFQNAQNGGGFKSFAVQHSGGLNALNTTKGPLELNVSGTPQHIQLNRIYHKSDVAGEIRASGKLNLTQGIAWDINTSLIRFKPQVFVPVKGELSGIVKTHGIWQERNKRIALEKLNVAGHLNGKPLRGYGNLTLLMNQANSLLPSQFEANDLRLAYANNKLQVSGNAQNLQLNVSAPALNELHPNLKGNAYGYIHAQVQPKVQAKANLKIDGLAFSNVFKVKNIQLVGDLPTSDTPAQLKLTLDELKAAQRQITKASLNLTGVRSAHKLHFFAENNTSELNMYLYGGLNAQNDWRGQLRDSEFQSKHKGNQNNINASKRILSQSVAVKQPRISIRQDQHANIVYTASKKQLTMGVHCWSSPEPRQTQLCWKNPFVLSPELVVADLTASSVALDDFKTFMPTGLEVTGNLNGYLTARWVKGQDPYLDTQLMTKNGVLGLAAENPEDPSSTLAYDEVVVKANTVRQGIAARVDVQTPEIGKGYASVLIHNLNTSQYSAATTNKGNISRRVQGEIAFNQIRLKVLKPFIQDVRSLDGELALAGKLTGTLAKPDFNGRLRLKNGHVAMMSLPVNLTNIQAYSDITGSNASIEGSFNSGRGQGLLTGNINWANELFVKLNLKTPPKQMLEVFQKPMIEASVVPNIDVDIRPARKALTVKGTVEIPKALIQMPEATVAYVGISPDVRVVYEDQDQLAILKAARPWKIDADIGVSLGNNIIFQGFGSTIPLRGALQLTQKDTEMAMQAKGAIAVSKEVTIETYGQSVDLERAIANFNGPLANPVLDIGASKEIQGDKIRITVTGTVKKPDVKIRSDGGLSEQEALNALVTGRIDDGSSGVTSTEGFKSDVNNTIAAAGISMGLGSTRALTNEIGRSFGLRGLALDAQGTGDDTQVSLTGYITPDLFIRYGVGVFTPVNKLTLRYQMNSRLYLEASQSLERAIDLFYNWRY